MHVLAKSMRQKLLTEQIGNNHTVLWETKNENGNWFGYTENFIRVILKNSTQELENKITKIKIASVDNDANYCIAESF